MHRRCFLPPLHEHELAADLLSEAAGALLEGKFALCAQRIAEADLRPLRAFAYSICGPIDPAIHHQQRNPIYSAVVGDSQRRMPSPSVSRGILKRDGYRCRYCACRVIVREARIAFAIACPDAARWGSRNEEKHFGLSVLAASIDHVLPFRRGGSHEPENLVTACGPCQFGRNQWTLAEVEIEDPRSNAPRVDSWDGLTRISGWTRDSSRAPD